MNEFIIDILTDSNFYLCVSFSFSICLLSWFIGYAIRLVMGLLYKIINVA